MSAEHTAETGTNTQRYPLQRLDDIIESKYWFYSRAFRKHVFLTKDFPENGKFKYREAGSVSRCLEFCDRLLQSRDTTDFAREMLIDLIYCEQYEADNGHAGKQNSPDIIMRATNLVSDIISIIFKYSKKSEEELREAWYEAKRHKTATMSDMSLKILRRSWGIQNLDHWSKSDAWTIEETAALSLKLEPSCAFDLPNNYSDDVLDIVKKTLNERIDIVKRAVAVEIFKENFIKPSAAKKMV